MQYPGGSAAKDTSRQLLHTHIHAITKPSGVLLFLAGPEGLDITVARSFGMRDDELIGAEYDPEAYRKVTRFHRTVPIYREDVATVALRLTRRGVQLRSVILDYCGCWTSDNEATTKKVVDCLKRGAHFSITLLRGRDGNMNDDPQCFVDAIIASLSTKQRPVTHTQTILYQSKREADGSKGSPMITMSFVVGMRLIKPEVIDLRKETQMSTEAANKAWKTRRKNEKKLGKTELAKKLSNAAHKAWATRRKNAKK